MSLRLRIVIADDDRDIREYVGELLARAGHDVLAAADGLELVRRCRASSPDLVVTDFAMPGLDGLSAAAEIVRDRPVPVILLSGRLDAELRAVANGGPVVRVLAKPFDPAELLAAVDAAAPPP